MYAFIRYEGDGDRAVDILKYMKTKVIEPIPEEMYPINIDIVIIITPFIFVAIITFDKRKTKVFRRPH